MNKKVTLIYMINTHYPNNKAHSIQITKTLFSLKKSFDIYFIANKFNLKGGKRDIKNNYNKPLYQEILTQYSYDLKEIKFIQIPKNKLVGINFFLSIYKLNKIIPPNSIFYTRSYNLARRLIKSKFIHNKKIILESHKKDGYYKEERIKIKTKYSAIRTQYEKTNINKKKLKRIYSNVDMVLFTSKNSEEIIKKDLLLKNTFSIWYPIDPKYKFTNNKKYKFVYIGSLHASKLIDLLLDALSKTSSIKVDVYGGNKSEQQKLIQKASQKNIASRINCKPFIPYSKLPSVLKNYEFGIAMVEGIKVVDYLECGVIPIIPRIATYTDIFDEDTVIYYQPDNPKDLAQKLTQANIKNINIDKLESIREFYSLKNFGQRLTKKILSL